MYWCTTYVIVDYCAWAMLIYIAYYYYIISNIAMEKNMCKPTLFDWN